jgi:hypothetical protein
MGFTPGRKLPAGRRKNKKKALCGFAKMDIVCMLIAIAPLREIGATN